MTLRKILFYFQEILDVWILSTITSMTCSLDPTPAIPDTGQNKIKIRNGIFFDMRNMLIYYEFQT